MDAWEILQLNMHWYQRSMQSTEAALANDKLDIKSFFVLSAVDAMPYPAELAKNLMAPKQTIT